MIWLTGISVCLLLLVADIPFASQAVNHVGWDVCIVMLAAFAAPVFAIVQTLVVRCRWQQVAITSLAIDRIRRGLLAANYLVWVSAGAAIVTIFHWPTIVRRNWQLNQWPLVDELVIVAPLIGSAILAWLVIYDAERIAFAEVNRKSGFGLKDRVILVGQRLRTISGLVLIPVLMLFAIRDLAETLNFVGQFGLATSFVFPLLLIGFWVAYPLIATATWRTAPLASQELQTELDNICLSRGLQAETVRIWDTQGTLVNAVVVGLVPGVRRIFLTDELLRQFDNREIHAIFRHELGHIVSYHLWIRCLVLLAPLLGICTIACLMSGTDVGQWISGTLESRAWLLWMLGPVAIVMYLVLVVVPTIRRSEIQADQYAILDSQGIPSQAFCDDYCNALLKLATHNPDAYLRSTALHPSIRERIRVIQQLVRPNDERNLAVAFGES